MLVWEKRWRSKKKKDRKISIKEVLKMTKSRVE